MEKPRFHLLVALCLALAHGAHAQDCGIPQDTDGKEFPDINAEGQLSYQLSVQFTITNDEIKQTSFYKEYRDIQNSKGRVDMISAGSTFRYYYFVESNETFEIQGDSCKSLSMMAIPNFMKEGVTEWEFRDNVRGPSAMFLNALDIWKNKRSQMAYMGKGPSIRGLNSQYWRRCTGTQAIDYYFTADDHDDVFGFDKLKQIPLRVQFGVSEQEPKFFPQTYEIMSFQPFVSERIPTLAVPSGIGCRRSDQLKDVPTIPDFSGMNIMTFGEASYLYGLNEAENYAFYSTFMFAMDVLTDHLSYFYTPWGGLSADGTEPDGFTHITYDMKNKYVYRNNLGLDTCSISREPQFIPRYNLPKSRGYIDLTDPMMLFPNAEFRYISDNKDRGFDVHTFEAVMENFDLGNRTVPKVIVTHNYLKDNEIINNVVEVRNTSLSIQFKIFTDVNKPHSEQLTVNLFGFATKIDHPQFVFSVASCMKNDDDFLFVTIGFAADKKVRDKIQAEAPIIQNSILASVIRVSELNPLRIPNIFVDFDDMIYATLTILDKPPVVLDFLEPETGKSIAGSTEVDGVMSLDGCATSCLEAESLCWGFAYCGATCYYGTGDKASVVNKDGCKLYRRYDNSSYMPTKESVANSLRSIVEMKQLKVGVPSIEDSSQEPEFLEASYFAITAPGESEEIFGLLGKQTNPRLRVVKAGYKLVNTGETIKNFGKLRYDQCQKLCLDYRRCETVSYCVKDSQCVLSLTYADDLPKEQMKEDNFCNLLAKKYAEHFDRSSGTVLSQSAKKTTNFTSPDDCARACLKEKDFDCLSFDLCPDSKTEGCRLHATHMIDAKNNEKAVTKSTSCGHYSKKFSYDYKKENNKKSVGVGFLAATNITLEECARLCDQLETGICYGYDFCGDKVLTSTSCYILNDDPSNYKTTYSAICGHFLQFGMRASSAYSAGSVAWVGAVTFFVAVVVGVLVTFGIGYYRANRQVS